MFKPIISFLNSIALTLTMSSPSLAAPTTIANMSEKSFSEKGPFNFKFEIPLKKLNVYFIHGFLGDKDTFCDFPKMLQEQFAKYFPGFRTKSIIYDTQNPSKGIADFTAEVRNYIIQDYRDNNIELDTPYSIIAHSQGGLVTISLLEKYILTDPDMPKQLTHVITLGTPFWGFSWTSMFNWMRWTESMLTKEKAEGAMQLLAQSHQFKELFVGSSTMNSNRKAFLNFDQYGNWINPFPSDIKFVSFSGNLLDNKSLVAKGSKALRNFLDQPSGEFDVAVDVASANPDFFYYIEPLNPKESASVGRSTIGADNFVVNMSHLPLPLLKAESLACPKSKNHAVYDYVQNLLQNYLLELDSDNNLSDWLTRQRSSARFMNSNFASEIRMKVPDLYQRPIKFKPEMVKPSPICTKCFESVKRDPLSPESQIKGASDIAFAHSGAFKPEYTMKVHEKDSTEKKLKYDIRIPGFEKKIFETTVAPGFTSYAEVQLKPYIPFKMNFIADVKEKDTESLIESSREIIASAVPFKLLEPMTPRNVTEQQKLREKDKSLKLPSVEEMNWFTKLQTLIVTKVDPKTMRSNSVLISNEDFSKSLTKDNQKLIDELSSKCFIGRTGKMNSVHNNKVYANLENLTVFTTLPEDTEVKVIGRFSSGKLLKQRYATDEDFYVIKVKDSVMPKFIELKNIDVLGPCQN